MWSLFSLSLFAHLTAGFIQRSAAVCSAAFKMKCVHDGWMADGSSGVTAQGDSGDTRQTQTEADLSEDWRGRRERGTLVNKGSSRACIKSALKVD